MIELRKAVNRIADEKRQIQEEAFRNVSLGVDAHLNFVRAVGIVQGLDLALDIILQITKDEDDRA